MPNSEFNRRQLAALAAGAATVAGLVAAGATPAEAYQGNMERALSSLYEALSFLREASWNKGGHRVKAMNLIQEAIAETQAGVEWADEHGGGGAQ